jgi:hypothetical protein
MTYGNLLNRIDENRCYKLDFAPTVGMGATEYMWSDRHAYSICEYFPNWKNKGFEIVGLQRDHAKRTDNNGMSDSQSWEFTPNPDAPVSYLRSTFYDHPKLGKVKMYEPVHYNEKSKRWNKGGDNIVIGHRSKYHDFSF